MKCSLAAQGLVDRLVVARCPPVDAAPLALDTVEQINGEINALRHIDRDQTFATACAIEDSRRRGAIHWLPDGVPAIIEGIIYTCGVHRLHGSRPFTDRSHARPTRCPGTPPTQNDHRHRQQRQLADGGDHRSTDADARPATNEGSQTCYAITTSLVDLLPAGSSNARAAVALLDHRHQGRRLAGCAGGPDVLGYLLPRTLLITGAPGFPLPLFDFRTKGLMISLRHRKRSGSRDAVGAPGVEPAVL